MRDQTVRYLRDADATLRAVIDDPAPLDRLASHLAVAELYWVTPQMSALAVGSAESLTEVRCGPDDRPATFGLLVWDGGIGGSVEIEGAPVPASAVAWGPDPAGLAVHVLVARGIVADRLQELGLTLVVGAVPPLVPTIRAVYPGGEWIPAEKLGDLQTLMTTLYATWALMQQPTIASRSRSEVDKAVRASYRRAGRPEPEVTLVDLRRRYVPAMSREDADEPGHPYRHRWVVQGHWRDQPYGIGRAQRRKQWIASYVKGPDGAPLLETTRVNVWRR